MKKKIKDLTLEEKEYLLNELKRIEFKYSKLKAKVLEFAIPTILINKETNEMNVIYSKGTQDQLDVLDNLHCKEIINLANYYNINLEREVEVDE